MPEQLILDPDEEIPDRVEVNLHEGALQVQKDGPDFGDSLIEQYMAKVARGSIPVGFSLPNRPVSIPLIAHDSGETLTAARGRLQAKVARIQQEGGILKRVMADASVYYLDVVSATLRYGAKNSAAFGQVDPDVLLVLDTLPDWYGLEVAYDTLSATGTLAQTIKTSGVDAVLPGDYPGRCRLVVSDTSGNDQLGLLWGVRSRHYSAASTAALKYPAQSLTPLDTAANATVASTACVRHQNLSTGWTPVLGTNLTAGTFLTHTGSYRAWARVYTTSAVPPKLRLVYDVGDLTLPAENKAVQIPGASNFYLMDLGEIRLDAVSAGTHRWQGVVQAKGAAGGENVSVAEVEFLPLDESMGTLVAPVNPLVPLAGYSARDEFNQAAGALASKTLPVGGTWSGAGDSDDFAVSGTPSFRLSRGNITADTADTGRFAIAGSSTFTASLVQADISRDTDNSGGLQRQGVLARYTDTSNYLQAWVDRQPASYLGPLKLRVRKCVAGVVTDLYATTTFPHFASTDVRTMRLLVAGDGRWWLWLFSVGAPPALIATGLDSALATGGALATGKLGIYAEQSAGSGAGYSFFDNFAAWVPTLDAAVFASQSAELATDGMSREDATGAAHGPVSFAPGDLPRIPPSGAEERPVELSLRGSRGDLDALPDTALDGISVTPHIRSSWLLIPGS